MTEGLPVYEQLNQNFIKLISVSFQICSNLCCSDQLYLVSEHIVWTRLLCLACVYNMRLVICVDTWIGFFGAIIETIIWRYLCFKILTSLNTEPPLIGRQQSFLPLELNVKECLGLILCDMSGGFFLHLNRAIQSFFNLNLLMSYGYWVKLFSLINAVSEGILSPQSYLPDYSDQT